MENIISYMEDIDNEYDDWTLTKEQRAEIKTWRKIIMAEADAIAKKLIKSPVNPPTDGNKGQDSEKPSVQDDKKLPNQLRHNNDDLDGSNYTDNWADNW